MGWRDQFWALVVLVRSSGVGAQVCLFVLSLCPAEVITAAWAQEPSAFRDLLVGFQGIGSTDG